MDRQMTESTVHTTQILYSLAKIYKTPYLLALGYQASAFIQPLENCFFHHVTNSSVTAAIQLGLTACKL